jgi:hypothetical protein
MGKMTPAALILTAEVLEQFRYDDVVVIDFDMEIIEIRGIDHRLIETRGNLSFRHSFPFPDVVAGRYIARPIVS